MLQSPAVVTAAPESRAAAGSRRRTDGLAGKLELVRVEADSLAIRRARRGRGFSYLSEKGDPIRDPEMLTRFASLAVPPAYTDVRFAADPCAHIQAIGRDDAGGRSTATIPTA